MPPELLEKGTIAFPSSPTDTSAGVLKRRLQESLKSSSSTRGPVEWSANYKVLFGNELGGNTEPVLDAVRLALQAAQSPEFTQIRIADNVAVGREPEPEPTAVHDDSENSVYGLVPRGAWPSPGVTFGECVYQGSGNWMSLFGSAEIHQADFEPAAQKMPVITTFVNTASLSDDSRLGQSGVANNSYSGDPYSFVQVVNCAAIGSAVIQTLTVLGATQIIMNPDTTLEPLRAAPIAGVRFPRLAAALREGRINGSGLPSPGSRTFRHSEPEPEAASESEQIGFGRSGALPADRPRRRLGR